MGGWSKFLFILIALGLVWLLYTQIKGNPEFFSGKNLNRSFWTLGWLALLLIGFIALLVFLLYN